MSTQRLKSTAATTSRLALRGRANIGDANLLKNIRTPLKAGGTLDFHESQPKDPQVKPERTSAQTFGIQLGLIQDRKFVPAIYLLPSGQPPGRVYGKRHEITTAFFSDALT